MCVNGASRLALKLTWPDVGSEIDSLIINELRCASSDKRISKAKTKHSNDDDNNNNERQ